MLESITRGPPADGGYPVDQDLSQMSDDGCPLAPDPARWADAEWRSEAGQGQSSARLMAVEFPGTTASAVSISIRRPTSLPPINGRNPPPTNRGATDGPVRGPLWVSVRDELGTSTFVI
jgi:hypothetical protein